MRSALSSGCGLLCGRIHSDGHADQREEAERRFERHMRALSLLELADEAWTHTGLLGERSDGDPTRPAGLAKR